MLRKINESTVISEGDFKIRFGHHSLDYIDTKSNHQIQIEIEDLVNPHKLIIYFTQTSNFWSDKTIITEQEKELLRSNIIASAQLLQLNFQIE